MLDPNHILAWLTANVKGMRLSRAKTLASIVPAAMEMQGVGVLPLGRAMYNGTSCKHNIKRVNRFLGNTAFEGEALAAGIFRYFAPRSGRRLVLADWTDVPKGKLLVFSLPANGRSIPFYARAVAKEVGEGEVIAAENEALDALARICPQPERVTVVADRGFGNQRWLTRVRAPGFHFVQRIVGAFNVDTEKYIGRLGDLPIRRGKGAKDWGQGSIGEDEAIRGRLVSAYTPEANEPWYLVTSLDDARCAEVVSIYRRRWWIETAFRDNKNRHWGLGLGQVALKHFQRYERLFYIVALAYILLSAHGAVAEERGHDRGYKANTRKIRVLSLLRMGIIFIRTQGQHLKEALRALRRRATLQRAPNWG